MPEIVGILLAAGASRRYGADKLSQCLPDGEPIALRAYRNLAEGCDRVVTVVRPDNPALADRLQAAGAEVAVCRDADLGMGHSLARGVQVASPAAGWLVALADMPWILPSTVIKVAEALRGGALVAAPVFNGRRGHPVGFAAALAPELIALQGDQGAKSVIQAHLHQLMLLDCDDPGIFRDIDRPEDLLPRQCKNPIC